MNSATPHHLYKYYSWSDDYDDFRLNGGLYFSSPKKFNDKLDCNLKIENNAQILDEQTVRSRIEELYPHKSHNEVASIYEKLMEKDPATEDMIYEMQQDMLGILCLSKRGNNPILWANYANNNGYCIKYNMQYLMDKASAEFKAVMGSSGREVWDPRKRIDSEYVNYKESITTTRKLFLTGHEDWRAKYWVKYNEWASEEEYRIGVSLGGNTKINCEGCIEEIILGINPRVDRYIHCLDAITDAHPLISVMNVNNGRLECKSASSIWPREVIERLLLKVGDSKAPSSRGDI